MNLYVGWVVGGAVLLLIYWGLNPKPPALHIPVHPSNQILFNRAYTASAMEEYSCTHDSLLQYRIQILMMHFFKGYCRLKKHLFYHWALLSHAPLIHDSASPVGAMWTPKISGDISLSTVPQQISSPSLSILCKETASTWFDSSINLHSAISPSCFCCYLSWSRSNWCDCFGTGIIHYIRCRIRSSKCFCLLRCTLSQ